jgi:uncharacterized membrane protein YeiH
MDTIGLVFTVLGSAAFIYGDFQGWDPKFMAGILVVTGFLIGMFVGRFRWQMASIAIVTVPASEWLVKQFHPYPTDLANKIPNPYLLFMLAVIVVAFPVTVGGGFRDVMARERPYTR